MVCRALVPLLVLVLPVQANAAGYVVRPGDTLGSIAQRYHASVQAIASANGITNVNQIRAGRSLFIPDMLPPASTTPSWSSPVSSVSYGAGSYQARWGDTLLGLSARFGLSVATIRALNPSLGPYLLAGQWLNLCGSCPSAAGVAPQPASTSAQAQGAGSLYVVQPGDTLSGIAVRYGVTPDALLTANQLTSPNRIIAGSRLTIPAAGTVLSATTPAASQQARSLIVTYAQRYGLNTSLPLAIGAQESGYNQNAVSRTGAIGVMQVEPYTANEISARLGRQVNLYDLEDNVHAGVFWLAHLLSYYGGDERLAVAAYYQGAAGLARHGFYQDTGQYVDNVMALKSRVGG